MKKKILSAAVIIPVIFLIILLCLSSVKSVRADTLGSGTVDVYGDGTPFTTPHDGYVYQLTANVTCDNSNNGYQGQVTISLYQGSNLGILLVSHTFDISQYFNGVLSTTLSPTVFITGVGGGYGIQYTLYVTVDTGPDSYTVNNAYLLYIPDYYIAVNSAHGSPQGGGYVTQGGSMPTNVTSPDNIDSGHRWVCTGYIIDSGSLTSGTSYTFTNLQNEHTITYYWQEQFYLTVNVNGISSQTGQGWYNSGATAYAGVNDNIVTVGTTRNVFSAWTGDASGSTYSASNGITMSSAKTASATWQIQYYLTVVPTIEVGSSGTGWYNSGATAYAGVSSSPVSGGTGMQYVFSSWGTDATGTTYSQSNGITMSAAKTATASWATQYYITINANGHGSPTQSSQWKNSGGSISVSVTSPESGGTGIQYVCTSDTTQGIDPITSAATITFTWKTQYYITITANGHGSPTQSSQWKDSGSSISCSVTSPESGGAGVQYVCTSSTTQSVNPITSAQTLTFTWKTQYYITINANGYGNPTQSSQWVNDGGSISVSVTSPYSTGTGTQERCTTATTLSISSVTYAQSLTFYWQAQSLITINANGYGNPTQSTQYVDNGGSLSCSVTSPYAGSSGIQYVCLTSTTQSVNPVSAPATLTFTWKTQYEILITSSGIGSSSGTVATLQGTSYTQAQLPATSAWIDSGSSCTYSFTSPVSGSTGIRYNWSSTGGVSQTLQSNTFTVSSTGTITGYYGTKYYLTVSSTLGSPTGQGWYNSGGSATFGITPGSNVFQGWTGSGTGSYTGSANAYTITMNNPVTETASWAPPIDATPTPTPSPTPSPSPTPPPPTPTPPGYTATPTPAPTPTPSPSPAPTATPPPGTGGSTGSVSGGSIFDITATSTGTNYTVSTIQPNFQSFSTTITFYQGAFWYTDGGTTVWDAPTYCFNTGYLIYGVSYTDPVTGLTCPGWYVNISIVGGSAGTVSGSDNAYIELACDWYNNNTQIKRDYLFCGYDAYRANDTTTQFELYINFWLSNQNSNSMVGGSVSAVYYGVTSTGWGPWASWGPVEGILSQSFFYGQLYDSQGNITIASALQGGAYNAGIFNVYTTIAKTDNGTGPYSDDLHVWSITCKDLQFNNLPIGSNLVGINTPAILPTTTFDKPLGFFAQLGSSMTSALNSLNQAISTMVSSASGVTSNMLDSAFNALGVSNAVTSITAYASSLGQYFSDAVTYISSTIIPVFTGIASFGLFVVTWIGHMIDTIIQIGGAVSSLLTTGQIGGINLVDTFQLNILGETFGILDSMIVSGALFLFIAVWWFDSIDKRSKQYGGGWMSFFMSDIQNIISVLSFIIDMTWRVISTVIGLGTQFLNILL